MPGYGLEEGEAVVAEPAAIRAFGRHQRQARAGGRPLRGGASPTGKAGG